MEVYLKVKNQLLYDYLKYLFEEQDGALTVSSTIPLGRLLIAHCKTSVLPVYPEGNHNIKLRLPHHKATENFEYKFLYYTSSDNAALNLALSATFDLDFAGYYRRGEILGIKKKDIIEAFIVSRKLFSTDCFDALHKRVYRREQSSMQQLTEKLLRKAYYIDETINMKGL